MSREDSILAVGSGDAGTALVREFCVIVGTGIKPDGEPDQEWHIRLGGVYAEVVADGGWTVVVPWDDSLPKVLDAEERVAAYTRVSEYQLTSGRMCTRHMQVDLVEVGDSLWLGETSAIVKSVTKMWGDKTRFNCGFQLIDVKDSDTVEVVVK